jgi:hypothetical protein
MGGLSARGLANAPVGDWSHHFMFIVAITIVAVHHLLRNSCHLGFQNFIRLMRRSRSWGLKLRTETNCSVRCWKAQKTAVLQLIPTTGEHLRRFAPLSGIQNFVNWFVANRGTNLRWTTSLIVFDSCQGLDAISRRNWNSPDQFSPTSCVVSRH